LQGDAGTEAINDVAPPKATSPPGPAPARALTSWEYAALLADVIGRPAEGALDWPADDAPVEGMRSDGRARPPSPARIAALSALAARVATEASWEGVGRHADCVVANDDCRLSFVARLGRGLFRRTLTGEEQSRYVRLHATATSEGEDFVAAARLVLQAMLQSPHFLYRLESPVEPPPGAQQDVVAARLSFLVTQSGAHSDVAPTIPLADTARQLLADPARARRGLRAFVEDWLQLYRLDGRSSKDAVLRAHMKAETLSFFERAAFDDQRDLMTLFALRQGRIHGDLATLYGLSPTSPDPADYDLSVLPARSGLLTQAALLAAPAKEEHITAIDRGLYILGTFLCGSVPEPPDAIASRFPGVPESLPDRERFALHARDPVCGTCHAVIDPLGLAFEAYDHLGRHRHNDDRGNLLRGDGEFRLDGSARRFDGPAGFAAILASSSTVERCIVEKYLRFALGRPLGLADQPTLERVLGGFRSGRRTFASLLSAVASDPAFSSFQLPESP
jgi:hypothetical protein